MTELKPENKALPKCLKCGSTNVSIERRPYGDTRCLDCGATWTFTQRQTAIEDALRAEIVDLKRVEACLRESCDQYRADVAKWVARGVEAQKCYEVAREKLAEMVACQDQLNEMHDAEVVALKAKLARYDEALEKIARYGEHVEPWRDVAKLAGIADAAIRVAREGERK